MNGNAFSLPPSAYSKRNKALCFSLWLRLKPAAACFFKDRFLDCLLCCQHRQASRNDEKYIVYKEILFALSQFIYGSPPFYMCLLARARFYKRRHSLVSCLLLPQSTSYPLQNEFSIHLILVFHISTYITSFSLQYCQKSSSLSPQVVQAVQTVQTVQTDRGYFFINVLTLPGLSFTLRH